MAAVEVAELCPQPSSRNSQLGSQAEILPNVRDAYIHGSAMTNVGRDVHYHNYSHIEPSGSASANLGIPPNPTELPSQLYSRLLMREGRGYPLMDATLPNELPEEYQTHGVRIGDVGIVTQDGYFDVLFNICEPADGTINGGCVPEGFIQLEMPPNNRHNFRRGRSYEEGGYAVSDHIQAGFSASMADQAAYEYKFQVGSEEGAILGLPFGASKEDVVDCKRFLEYAAKHGIAWYEFVNNTLGRDVTNGSIYLITGHDKAHSWGTASFFASSTRPKPAMRFNETGWHHHHGRVFAKRGPNCREATTGQENQCIFLRGYKVTLGATILARLFGVKVVDTSPLDKITSNTDHWGLLHLFKISNDLATNLINVWRKMSAPTTSDASEPIVTSTTPSVSSTIHPSNLINLYLLNKFPDSDLAITHDSIWCSYLTTQSDFESGSRCGVSLFEHIEAEYSITRDNGAVYLLEQANLHEQPSPDYVSLDVVFRSPTFPPQIPETTLEGRHHVPLAPPKRDSSPESRSIIWEENPYPTSSAEWDSSPELPPVFYVDRPYSPIHSDSRWESSRDDPFAGIPSHDHSGLFDPDEDQMYIPQDMDFPPFEQMPVDDSYSPDYSRGQGYGLRPETTIDTLSLERMSMTSPYQVQNAFDKYLLPSSSRSLAPKPPFLESDIPHFSPSTRLLSGSASVDVDEDQKLPSGSGTKETMASTAILLGRKQRKANFKCPICGNVLTSMDNLRNHIDAHNNVRRHACDNCGDRFRTRSVLRRHQNSSKCKPRERVPSARSIPSAF